MSGLVLSKKINYINNKETIYYDIEDGQTRLSILQDFHACRFKLPNDYTFDMLDLDDQNRFLDYTLTLEIIENEADTLADYDNHIHEMFERLQGGKRLSDDDKYWNRYYSNSPLVKFAFDIIKNKEIKEYLNIKKFSSDNRKGLTNICGLIGAFLFADISNNFSYWPAFRCQF